MRGYEFSHREGYTEMGEALARAEEATMDRRRVQVRYTERLFPGQVVTDFVGPLEEAPFRAMLEDRIRPAIARGETSGVVVRDGMFLPADRGAHRFAWWIADDGRHD